MTLKPLSSALFLLQLAAGCGLAQTKTLAFEVVSMRPSKPGGMPSSQILRDGYSAKNQSLWTLIMTVYIPQGYAYWPSGPLAGAPGWVGTDSYDIDARVAQAELPEWQKPQNQRWPNEMLAAMLQSLLAQRCQLTLHRVPTETSGYDLLVGKHGPKLQLAKPNEALPPGAVQLADGGVVVPYRRGEKPQETFYGASMTSLAKLLQIGPNPVEDKTGLKGRYDFVLHDREDADGVRDDPNPADRWDLDELGLAMKPAKIPASKLVVDHIERPSPN